MTWGLLVVVTVVTLASRLLPMVFLPAPRGRLAETLDGLPAPLFASLAALALVGDGGAPDVAVLLAAAAALLGASRRSLAITLACGIAGFLAARALLP